MQPDELQLHGPGYYMAKTLYTHYIHVYDINIILCLSFIGQLLIMHSNHLGGTAVLLTGAVELEGIHLKLILNQISWNHNCLEHSSWWSNRFEILQSTQQCCCHTLCKISKQLVSWNECKEWMRFRKICNGIQISAVKQKQVQDSHAPTPWHHLHAINPYTTGYFFFSKCNFIF